MKTPADLAALLEGAAACEVAGDTDAGVEREPAAALLSRGERILGGLQAAGARPGAAVLLVHADPRAFYAAFWACQLGGLVAVPLAPPAGGDDEENRRLRGVWELTGSPLILCENDFLAGAVRCLDSAATALDQQEFAAGPPGARARLSSNDLAMLQFTSGSTRTPRGVELTHANLLANLAQMTARLPVGPDDVVLNWMPHFHDLGLFGGHLMALLAGARQVQLPPSRFLRAPERWLDLATTERATVSAATNTALRLMLRRIERAESRWDLSPLHAFMIGAEPISAAVLRDFAQRFAPCRLRSESLRICYGLAEACVGISFAGPEPGFRALRLDREALAARRVAEAETDPVEIVDAGPPLDGVEVRIADDEDRPLGEREIGHLQARGPNLSRGYHRAPDLTAAARCGDWWRTGDLGFLDRGRVVVCGRAKDLLLVGGRNVHAHDVEAIACEEPGIREAVACAVGGGGEERTVLFLATDAPRWSDALPALEGARRRVHRRLRIPVDDVVPVVRREIPRTTSGKVRRARMAELFRAGAYDAVRRDLREALAVAAAPPTRSDAEATVRRAWSEVLGVPEASIDGDVPFLDLGGSSLQAYEVLSKLESATGRTLGDELLLSCRTVAEMARFLAGEAAPSRPEPAVHAPAPPAGGAPIAIVSLSCRFPGAPDPQAFADALARGFDAVRDDVHGRVGPGSFLDAPWDFDPAFFGIPEREARVMDPQQRLALELASEAVERAGHGAGQRRGRRVGVFVGASQVAHQELFVEADTAAALLSRLESSPALASLDERQRAALREALGAPAGPDEPSTLVGNLPNMLAARVAQALDLDGPALVVDTACSSALVALHLACESLRRGECDEALVGGVNLNLTSRARRLFAAAGALSRSGRCRPFAAGADGIVLGEGGAFVLVRPLDAALRDGDRILAIVRGSAVNNDGRSLGPMAPSPRGQRAVLEEAYRAAGVDPATVSLLEAHGTGTVIGDPVEVRALADVFGGAGGTRALGSVKSNLGHLLGAAGIASLAKVLLSFEKRTLWPTLHCEQPNPRLPLADGGMRLVARAEPWEGPRPLRAGVSSLGFGGTNCHVVLEEPPELPAPVRASAPARLLRLSAPAAVHVDPYASALAAIDESAATAAAELSARTEFPERRAVVARDDSLSALLSPAHAWKGRSVPPVIGLPTTLGAGRGSARERHGGPDPLEGTALSMPLSGTAVPGSMSGPARRTDHSHAPWKSGRATRPPRIAFLFPGQGSQHPAQGLGLHRHWPAFRHRFDALSRQVPLSPSLRNRLYGDAPDADLRRTDVSQPLLLVFQAALAGALEEAGLRPAAVLGHSVGELAAACACGALETAQALAFAIERGRRMEALAPPGGMLAVLATEERVRAFVRGDLAIAARNGPEQLVLAGTERAIDEVAEALGLAGLRCARVPVSRGFHSPAIAPALGPLADAFASLSAREPRVPFASTVLGRPASASELGAAYWHDHAARPVEFAQAFRALASLDVDAFLEVGPGAALAGLGRRLLAPGDRRPVLSLCRTPGPPDAAADWEQLLGALGELWVRGAPVRWTAIEGARVPSPRPLPTIPFQRRTLRAHGGRVEAPARPAASPVLVPSWKPAPAAEPDDRSGTRVILGEGLAEPLCRALRERGERAVHARVGASFARESDDRFTLDASRADHLRWLFESLSPPGPAGIVLLPDGEDPNHQIRQVHALAAALASRSLSPSVWTLTTGALAQGGAPGRPALAAALRTAAGVLADDPGLAGGVVDLDPAAPDEQSLEHALAALRTRCPRVVAWRNGARLVESFETVAAAPAPLRPGGRYLVLGATGGVGRALARHLAEKLHPSLALVGRRSEDDARPLVRELRALGADASYRSLDVSDPAALSRLASDLFADGGRLDGVIHAVGDAVAGSLAARSDADLRRVVEAKCAAAACLAAALAERDVGFVALVSSVSASHAPLSRGLADYAGANAYLDALALEQRARGRPWTSIAFAAWRGTGLAAALPAGTAALEPAEACAAFERALACNAGHVVVAPPEVFQTETPPAPSAHAPSPAPAELPPLSSDDLEQALRVRIARAAGCAPAALDPDAPFASLGIDSLAALDLVKELEQRTGRTLSRTLLLEQDTLAKLVAHLRTALASPASAAPTPAPVAAPVRALLPSQKTFYANQRFHPELPGDVYVRLDLAGPLHAAHLDRALPILHARHEVLRAAFPWEGHAPVQRADAVGPPRVEEAWREPDDLEAELRNRPFDLEAGPLLRVALCRRPDHRASLLVQAHHIVADAWSTQLLLRELLELHEKLRRGEPPELPALRTTWSECADAIERAARTPAGEEARRFWERTLRDVPPLTLPWDGDPDAPPRGPCALHLEILDERESAALASLASSLGATPFQLVLASYLLSLRTWSGQDDLLVRVANARRELSVPDIERVVGSFADSLPVRVRAERGLSTAELVGRTRAAVVEAQRHALTSSLELAGLAATRGPAGPRGITPAGISFPSFHAPDRVGDLRVEGVRAGTASGFTQLGLVAWEHGGRFHFSWNHLEPLFSRETMARLAREHLETVRSLLRGADASRPAARPPLPSGAVVHERFALGAQANAERVAVGLPGRTLTYRELAERVDRLAGALSAHGTAPHGLVGVLARPSLEGVAGVLGILSSGAAYVPMDPDYPDARVAQIAADARLRTLVTTADQAPRLDALAAAGFRPETVLLLDDPAVGPADPRVVPWSRLPHAETPRGASSPDDLAYVMYTSGTTGRPKGVMVRHRAVSLFHDWVHDAFEIDPNDRFVQTSSLSFGGSIRQIYSPLLAGASVWPAPPGLTRDPAALLDFLETHRITIWNSVPTLWARLLESIEQLEREGRSVSLPDLRWILIGGENVPSSLVRRWIDRFGDRHGIANLYGSTETIVNATWHRVRRRPADDERSVPIGVPRAGSEVRLLDEAGRPCAPGETGELHCGGPSLADGYLHAPEATARAFVTAPDGSRWYRTGDIARRDASGVLHYIGRRDSMVKIHGNRVELGEIEAALQALPEVKAAAVVLREEDGEPRLAAYVAARPDVPVPDAKALREHVRRSLPAYMVPHRLEVVDALPLTSAGKIDRRALGHASVSPAPERPAARTPTEEAVARAWAEVLHVPSVGLHDDFFSLGGDSILALDVLQRLRGRVRAVPRPPVLFRERTVARLAAAIDASTESGVLVPAGTGDGPFPLTPQQSGFLLAGKLQPDSSPTWSADLPVQGELNVGCFREALNRLVARHPMLRTVFEPGEPRTLQRVLARAEAPLDIVDLRLETDIESSISSRFAALRSQPFDTARGPLWRSALCRIDERRWRWLVAVHHAVADGWSLSLLGSELLHLHEALRTGAEPSLPPLRTSFRDVVALRERAATNSPSASRAWWSERLRAPATAVEVGAGPGGTVARVLGDAETRALRREAARRGTGLFTLIFAAFGRALRRRAPRDNLLVGTATSGRELPLPDIDRIVGCLASALPVPIRIANVSFDADFDAVRSAFEAAVSHELPVEEILRLGPPGGPLPGTELFYSFLDLRSLPSVTGGPLAIDWESADLGFAAQATGTKLMLGAMAGDRLRLHLHGSAANHAKEEIAEELLSELRRLIAATVDSAIVAYLPAPGRLSPVLPGTESASLRALVREAACPGGRPRLVERTRTAHGTSGSVLLPVFADELSTTPPSRLSALCADGVRVAERAGARAVSLAGLLPSRTDYGRAVTAQGTGGARVTNGHGVTAAAVLLTLERLLRDLRLEWAATDLAIVGYGSIGRASLQLILDSLGAPRSLLVCEVPERVAATEDALAPLHAALGGRLRTGPVSLLADAPRVIVGAASVGNLLAADALPAGCVLADDSLPPLIEPSAARTRMEQAGDVLVVSAGELVVPASTSEILADDLPPERLDAALRAFVLPGAMAGCRAEALLLASRPGLPAVEGLVDPALARRFLAAVHELGMRAPALHLGPWLVPDDVVARVRDLLGRRP